MFAEKAVIRGMQGYPSETSVHIIFHFYVFFVFLFP